MRHEVYHLNKLFPQLKESAFEATLTTYCADNSPEIGLTRLKPTIVICPGGGYAMTSDREAEPVALEFAARNFNTFILRYSCAPARYPQALLELSASVALIRRQSDLFHTNPDQIAVCGFSAGGHLACSLGALWNEPFLSNQLELKSGENRPDAMILGYPVITSGSFTHIDSMRNLLGSNASQCQMDNLSLENQVGSHTPPAFIWHTFDDEAVPVQNSLLLASALKKYGVPFDLHIFTHGPHGLSLCDGRTGNSGDWINPECAIWVTLCENWLKKTFSL